MPKTIKNDDGTEEEVFTKEELEAKSTEAAEAKALEEREKAEADKNEAMAAKEEELANTKAELEKLKAKEMNFDKTRRAKEKDEVAEGELKKSIETMQKELNEYRKQPIEDAKADFVKKHIGDNKELKDKFDVYMNKLGTDIKSKADAEKVFVDAYVLANDGKKPEMSSQMMGATVDENFARQPDGHESENSKEIGRNLGISEDDKKNFGPGKKSGLDLIKPNAKAPKN